MPFDRNIFINNVLYLVKSKCNDNATIFNGIINQRDAVTRWKKAEFKPSLETLFLICDKFDVSIDWLLTGKEPRDTASMSQYAVNEEQTHDAGGVPHCPFCGEMTEEVKEICKKVKEITECDNVLFASLLKTIIAFFDQYKYEGKEKREPLRKLKQKILSFSK